MKRFFIVLSLIIMTSVLCSGAVHATAFPTPGPYLGLTFGSDVEQGVFSHSGPMLSIELFDLGDLLATGFGSAFGFYFTGTDVTDLTNLHGIFDVLDNPSLQFAAIDFNLGIVFDIDSGVIQHTFTPSMADIGFFILPVYGSGLPILFTDPVLNPGGIDVSGTFPVTSSLGTDDYLISFSIPGVTPLTAHFVDGIVPVPEPSTLLCLASGLGGLLIYRKRRIK